MPQAATYLDYNATAPLRPQARDAMLAAMDVLAGGGNPSSVHRAGRMSHRLVEDARRDVAALAETLVDAHRLGLDLGAADVLARYQSWRRFDNLMLIAATDSLNRLFSNDLAPVRLARDLGLGAALGLVGQVKIFQTVLGVGVLDGGLEFVGELALLLNALEDGGTTVFQFPQIAQTFFQVPQLAVIQ